jgi:hypothetical protein
VLAAVPVGAQATGGALEARLTDEQGLALPGAIVTVRDQATGFQRSLASDALGWVRFPHLPIGRYDVRAEMTGFARRTSNGVRVDVGATTSVDIRMAVAGRAEELTVTGEAPFIDVRRSGVGEIVTAVQIENLPLNGRQFGNLAALVPGVGLGFHNDPTKSTQFAPQVAGGTGRNVSYQIDGGDDNDDTVGGLVQGFPLDAVAEFNFTTQRFKAEYGRSDGGVLSVVTKSGTNTLSGSAFTYFRDEALNARTETERLNDVPKGDYRRWQYGGSLGGPVRKDRTHFFLSFERIQQDTTQSVDTGGLFPEKDGVFGLPYRESVSVAKFTHQINPSHFLSVRYGFNDNSQVYGADPQTPPESWGTSTNTFHSANAGLVSTLGSTRTNELLFQYSYFHNHIGANSTLPTEAFPGGVLVGQNPDTPQDTLQKKLQVKDDFAWVRGRHELKAGVAFIAEPKLQTGGGVEASSLYIHLEDSRTSPVSEIDAQGPTDTSRGFVGARIPNQQYGLYVQDSWRATDRLVLDIGVRYDLVIGMAFDQSKNRVFRDLQDAAAAGRLVGIQGLEDFGHPMTEDKNNVAPRLGFTYDVKGNGRLVVRGGYGRYYDVAYTNSYVLFPAGDTQSTPPGLIYFNSDSTGIKNPDGTFYRVGQPLPPNQAVVGTENSATNVASPLIRQPYTDQVNLGLSLALGQRYAIDVDGVGSRGRNLGRGMNLNTTPNLGPYRFADILPNVGSVPFLVWTPRNKGTYQGVTIAFRRQWDGRLQFLGSYTLSKARSTARAGTDEFSGAGLLDATQPFSAAQFGPSATDARHRVTISGVWSPGAGFTVAPIFRFHSRLPYNMRAGSDLNRDGVNFDLPPGITTVMAGRGASFSQLDVRVSKLFHLRRTRLQLLAEVFNVFDARNPAGFVGNMASSQFGQPTAFAGDAGLGEQRLAQLGVRLEF